MDHLDWFAPGSKDVEDEVGELARVLASGGFVLWRSAARQPWYQEVYVERGLFFFFFDLFSHISSLV